MNFLNQYQQAGGNAKLIGGSIMVDQTVLSSKGKAKEALIGVASAGPQADTWDDPKWQAFVKAYQQAPNEGYFKTRFTGPSLCAANYYDETQAALLALDKVNGDLSDGQKKFRAALASLVLDAPNGQIKLDENRQAIGTSFVTEVVKDKNGDLVSKVVKVVPNVDQRLGFPRRRSTRSVCRGAKCPCARRPTIDDPKRQKTRPRPARGRELRRSAAFVTQIRKAGEQMLPRIRIKGATIVSMDPKIGIIDTGDILIDNGKIIEVGKNVRGWAVREIDGRGLIAMPGFVNGHIHLWQAALRGIAADWTLDHYFGVLIGKVVGLYTPQDVYIGNLVGALDQINSGVTTLFDWCHIVNTPAHADAAVDALQEDSASARYSPTAHR